MIRKPRYVEGTFNIYHDTVLRTLADRYVMDYTNGFDYSSGRMDKALYEDFRRAYLRDLMQFDYSFARANLPVGKVSLSLDDSYYSTQGDERAKAAANYANLSVSCPVYASFDNTIAFLDQNGLWLEAPDYDALSRLSAARALTPKEQEYLDRFDYWSIRGPFSSSEF